MKINPFSGFVDWRQPLLSRKHLSNYWYQFPGKWQRRSFLCVDYDRDDLFLIRESIQRLPDIYIEHAFDGHMQPVSGGSSFCRNTTTSPFRPFWNKQFIVHEFLSTSVPLLIPGWISWSCNTTMFAVKSRLKIKKTGMLKSCKFISEDCLMGWQPH